jgi:hypothetical protein
VAIMTTRAEALPEPKVAITYSLRVQDGGSYRQQISETLLTLGDADFLCVVGEDPPVQPGPDGDDNVVVFVDDSLLVTLEFTTDAMTGDIIDGPVEITDTHFEREFEIDSGGFALVNTTLTTNLSRVGTGTLSGTTITWDNVPNVNVYQELVVGTALCTGSFCPFVEMDLGGTNDVPLPDFTVGTISVFADTFVSDNGTPSIEKGDNLNSDDILRQDDDDAVVWDTWTGVEFVPEPSRDVLLLAGVLGLAGLTRLRERGGVSAFFANRR